MVRWCLTLLLFVSASLCAETNVLIFAGSMREGSFNKNLAKEAAAASKELGAKVTLIDLKDFPMPFYDEDLEKQSGMPMEAKRLRRLMVANDIIIIASPNYNGSFSGLLKTALDWASRTENSGASRDAFQGKTFVLLSASPGKSGGAGGLRHLKEVIEVLKGQVVAKQVSVPLAHQYLDTPEHFTNSPYKNELRDLLQSVIKN